MNSKQAIMELSQFSFKTVLLETKLTKGFRAEKYPLTESNKRFFYSLFFYKFLTIALLFVLSILTTIGYTGPIDTQNYHRLVNLDLKDKDFIQVLSAISDQVGIEIVFSGEPSSEKKDIKISNASLDQAIAQVIRRYKVKNHTIVYNAKDDIILQFELHGYAAGSSVMPSASSSLYLSNINRQFESDYSPLTFEQMEMLIAQSEQIEAEMQESMQTLTSDQIAQLKEESDKLEAKYEKIKKPLTDEQLEKLKVQSQQIELEEKKDNQPLTQEQIQELKKNSDKIESEMRTLDDSQPQPLTEEQKLLLQNNTK